MSIQHSFESTPSSTTPDADQEQLLDEEQFVAEDGSVLYEDQVAPEFGVLGFTLRELIIVGVWLLAFAVSFFPLLGASGSVWAQGISWVLPIGLPTVAVFLIVLHRFSPDGIRRVGSLGIDQFASVAFSVSAIWWAETTWSLVSASIAVGVAPAAWVPWAGLVLSVALVVATVFAPLIPELRDDFIGRLETLAHRNANPVRPVIARPRAPKAAKPETPVADAAVPGGVVGTLDVELSGESRTDEVARLDLAGQVPLSAHASGGDTGSTPITDSYAPAYARRSRPEEDAADEDAADRAVPTGTDFAPIAELGLEPEITEHSGATDATVTDGAAQPVEGHHLAGSPVVEAGEAESFEPVVDEPVVDEPSVEPVGSYDVDATNPRFAPAAQPFWALAPSTRDVVDERGEPIFRIGPDAWALVIEDRGGAFVVRHDDGRIGYLHDIDDITKG